MSQIEANLSDALAPFAVTEKERQNVTERKRERAKYHIVPATSSSENQNARRSGTATKTGSGSKRKRKRDEDSLLSVIFGDGQSNSVGSSSKYQRSAMSSKHRKR